MKNSQELAATKRFALEKYSDTESRLLDDGLPIGTLSGRYLEAQYQLGIHSLLFLSEDCPHEEFLHIYLLAPGGRVLDLKGLGGGFPIGNGGIFERERVISPRQVEFSFQGEWRLTVRASNPDFDLPPATEAKIRPGMAGSNRSGLFIEKCLRLVLAPVRRAIERTRETEDYTARQDILLLEEIYR